MLNIVVCQRRQLVASQQVEREKNLSELETATKAKLD